MNAQTKTVATPFQGPALHLKSLQLRLDWPPVRYKNFNFTPTLDNRGAVEWRTGEYPNYREQPPRIWNGFTVDFEIGGLVDGKFVAPDEKSDDEVVAFFNPGPRIVRGVYIKEWPGNGSEKPRDLLGPYRLGVGQTVLVSFLEKGIKSDWCGYVMLVVFEGTRAVYRDTHFDPCLIKTFTIPEPNTNVN